MTRERVARSLERAFDLEVAETKAAGHARHLAQAAGKDGFHVVTVLGGDGTVNEAANGLIAAGGSVPLAILPGGGANVFARSVGISTDAEAASRSLIRRAASPATDLDDVARVPMGRVEGRYFLSSCGFGFDGAIVREVERSQRMKHRFGELLYVWHGVGQFFAGYDRQRPHVTLSWGEDLEHSRNGLYLAITQNASPLTFLGKRPLRVCPEVTLGDGLHCLALDSFRTDVVLPVLLSAFGQARHASRPHVTYLRGQPRIAVRSDVPLPVQMDGEYLGERTDLDMEWVPDVLAVL